MTAALQRALRETDQSIAAIARATGITRQSLMLFARGERTIYLDAADRLAAHFGIRLSSKE